MDARRIARGALCAAIAGLMLFGADLGGGPLGEAHAQPATPVFGQTFDVACDMMREEVMTEPAHRRVTHTRWYAELSDPAFGPTSIDGVTAMRCGRASGSIDLDCHPREPHRVCDGDPAPEALSCEMGEPQVSEGLIRVSCGHRVRWEFWDGTVMDWQLGFDAGVWFTTVRMTVIQ